MNFKIKAVAAALALAAAGHASAGTTDLVFFVVDDSTSTSFMYDLGPNTFNPTTSVINATNVTTNSAWTAFTTANPNALAGDKTTWGVFTAVDNSHLASTVDQSLTSITATLVSSANSQATLLANATGMTGGATGTAHYGFGTGQDNAFTDFTVAATGISAYGQNLWSATNPIGATNVAFDSATPGGRGIPLALTTFSPTNGNGFAFDGTNVTYNVPAVPEPETYGMLAAGLLMLGAMVRRRKA